MCDKAYDLVAKGMPPLEADPVPASQEVGGITGSKGDTVILDEAATIASQDDETSEPQGKNQPTEEPQKKEPTPKAIQDN